MQAQSAYLSYVDVFWVLMLLSLAAVPLAMSLRKVKLAGSGAGGALRLCVDFLSIIVLINTIVTIH